MKQKVNGFTLLEIVLALAIAGAIFAAIFVALSGIWADERDNERRSDMMTFIRQLKNYQTSNSRGALPGSSGDDANKLKSFQEIYIKFKGNGTLDDTNSNDKEADSWINFYNDYFDKNFVDPDGVRYNLRVIKCKASRITRCANLEINDLGSGSFSDNNYTISVVTSAVCDGEDAKKSANSRNVAVLYRMEAGGVYCENT